VFASLPVWEDAKSLYHIGDVLSKGHFAHVYEAYESRAIQPTSSSQQHPSQCDPAVAVVLKSMVFAEKSEDTM